MEKYFANKDLGVISKVPLKVSVVLGKTKLSLAQLIELKEGSIVELDKTIGEYVDIYVEDSLVAKGEVVISGDELGIEITQMLVTEDK